MARSDGWSEAENRRLVLLHGQGLTQAKVCQEMGRSSATIQRKAKALGLSWNGASREGPATRAAQNAERREDLAERLDGQVHALLERLMAPGPFSDLIKGEYGSESMAELPKVPTKSLAQLTQAIKNLGTLANDYKKLNMLHTDNSDMDSWLKAKIRLEIVGTTDPGYFMTGDQDAPRSTGELQEGI